MTPRPLRLGKTTFGETPRVAVSFGDRVSAATIKNLPWMGVDIVELRIDLFSSLETAKVLANVRRFRGLPVLATIRSKKEGGRWSAAEKKREELFRAVLPWVQGVDIELSSQAIRSKVIRAAKAKRKLVVVSFHDFRRTPSLAALNKIYRSAKAAGADLVKIAAMPNTKEDYIRLAEFTKSHRGRGVIVIAMGRRGAISRVFFPTLGSVATFSYLGSKPMAPGQLPYREVVDWLRQLHPRFSLEKASPIRRLGLT